MYISISEQCARVCLRVCAHRNITEIFLLPQKRLCTKLPCIPYAAWPNRRK